MSINHTSSKYQVFTVLLLFFSFGLTNCSPKEKNSYSIEKGQLNLKEWDFNNDGIVKLNGEWEFYWNHFILSEDSVIDKIEAEHISVPGLWNEHISNGKKIENIGYGSYRLKVSIKEIEELAIKYINASSSAAIYVDGALLYESGKPNTSKETAIAGYRPEVISFIPKANEFEIIIHISNYHHKKGGQWEPLILGQKKQIQEFFNLRIFLEILSAGFIFIMVLFHLTLYSRFPDDKPLLYFAIFSFFISIRFIVDGEFSIFMMGDFSWSSILHISYLSFYLAVLFFFLYFKSLFPKLVNTIATRIIVSTSLVFSASVILLPTEQFSYGMIYFQLFTIISCFYLFPVLFLAIKEKREGAKFLLIGFVIVFLCLIHDTLEVNEIIYSTPLSSYGITIFILMQAYFLSIRIRKALEHNKVLSHDLQIQNEEYCDLNIRYKEQNERLLLSKDRAEESDRLKSSFLANMSHEIRTPMNGIMGFASLLKMPELSPEERKESIEIIEKSGQRMLNIINDIIDISKIESGLMEVYIKESDINDQVQYIYTFFKPEVEAKGMKLILKNQYSRVPTIIKTDSEKVFAILTNLVKNAIKYSAKGIIEYGFEIKGNFLEFYVKDDGIGIAQGRQEAVFERFIQADISNKMALSGAGLGLSITKAYVELLGGKIWLESQEGKGSTFFFTLPYQIPEESETIKTTEQTKVEEIDYLKSLKIMIAEDDETSKTLIVKLVRKLSKEIIEVTSGIEAVEQCCKHSDIDLILMDIQMPEMNGHEATQEIRKFNKEVIIIAQTAYGLAGDKEKALEAGCNEYLAKPIDNIELYSLIKKYFGAS
ncbi:MULTISPECIES: ATP-binding protein [unclassified Lentimicrobium]|uniref:ATP-binding protein n=1 Tax=unclassified Lentimicrobium TaxID=2677434 RepID=UPI0015580F87|nr:MULTISPECIES: ATP-binding protein [unclassified Lentimicrobium]NPD45526.1 response regulator [Lentimicrobium sp. S6]NPD84036.1 response regulator [Lentimicrobium sp. L6]